MSNTKIEWTDKSWNPITGCSPVSEGCRNCYAKRMANRLRGRYGYPKDEPFRVTFHPDRLDEPLRWKKPSRIFVVSMGDLFHKDVDHFKIAKIWNIAHQCQKHIFLFLTKRPDRLKSWTLVKSEVAHIPPIYGEIWPNNCWLGVSVENQKTADERIPILLQIPAAKRFVSVEPMLGQVDIKSYFPGTVWYGFRESPSGVKIIQGLDWVCCGGETGPGARPMHPDWVRSLLNQCQVAGVPFFFKKWGDWFLKTQQANFIDRQIDGKKWEEFPK
jgi:protein gp37